MRRFLQLFLDIALWRKGPQDLPASTSLLALVVIQYMCLSYVQVRLLGHAMSEALMLTCIDVGVAMAWVMMVLSILGLRPRLTQAMTAMFGVGVLFTLLALVAIVSSYVFGGSARTQGSWDLLHDLLLLLSFGRIFSVTTERNLLTGVILAFVMMLLVLSAFDLVLPVAASTP
jgi:hypothetical protein